MKFEEALVELRKGKKIRNKLWGSSFFISLEKRFNTNFDYNFIHEDWEAIEKPGKTFDQVFEEFKEGKKIRRISWDEDHYMKLHDLESCDCNIVDIIENDWEVI